MADNEFLTGYLSGQSENRNNSGLFGGGWEGIIGLIVILALLGGGFGMGGFGGFGGGFGRGVGCGGNCATQADVRAAVDQQTLISKMDQQTYGLADTAYALNNTIVNGFHGVDNAVCNLGFNVQQAFNSLSAQLAQCCCDTRSAIQANTTQGIMNTSAIQKQISDCCCDMEKMNMQSRFDAERANCGTLQAIDKLGDRILGYMANQETMRMHDELQAYRLQASQAKQNQYLIDQLRPSPVPAYITCNPYAASYGFGHNGYGRDGGCFGFAA